MNEKEKVHITREQEIRLGQAINLAHQEEAIKLSETTDKILHLKPEEFYMLVQKKYNMITAIHKKFKDDKQALLDAKNKMELQEKANELDNLL